MYESVRCVKLIPVVESFFIPFFDKSFYKVVVLGDSNPCASFLR